MASGGGATDEPEDDVPLTESSMMDREQRAAAPRATPQPAARRFALLRRVLPAGWRARLRRQADGLRKWAGLYGSSRPTRDPADATRFFIGPLRVRPEAAHIELDIEVRLTWDQTRDYVGSKLYFRTDPRHAYAEAACIFFWLRANGRPERLRLVLPAAALASGWLALRLDALPLTTGAAELRACRLVAAGGPDAALERAAVLHAMKLRTDREVVHSLASGREVLPHYPQALSMEIQPRCNLTCAHCPTHGKPELHRECNALREMDVELLDKIAHEVFPHVDCVNLVGRGEPLYVSDRLWTALLGHLERYGAMLVVVTNGTLVRERITPQIIPLIETLSFSIDGATPQTFAANRGGARLDRMLEAVAHYHALRRSACLPRRPKLSISWTIKKNNVAELPGFVRFMAQFEPDKYFFRYMVLCEELELDQSLLGDPELANGYLRDAYAYLEEQGVEVVRPPLFAVAQRGESAAAPAPQGAAGDAAAAPQMALKDGGASPQMAAQGAAPRPLAAANPAAASNALDASDALDVPGVPDSPGTSTAMAPSAVQPPLPGRRCPHMFAEGAILAGGAIMSCQAYFAEAVGDMNTVPDYMSVWSGPRMQSLRAGLASGSAWVQCNECWISQMHCYAPAAGALESTLHSEAQLTELVMKAWDLRHCDRR